MFLGLTESLPSLVEVKYRSAKAASSLIFSPTELAVIRTPAGIPFQLRYCPALAKKPQPQKAIDAPKTKKPDPFESPSSDLLIAEIPSANPSHVLVLNKFPVIEGHFIIATKTNKQQTHVLEQDDLEATYACLKAWLQGEASGTQNRLFAFFNSGDHSGASQPHRHLQFLPIENMMQDEQSNGWDLLIDLVLLSPHTIKDPHSGLLHHPSLPFTHWACRLPSEPTGLLLLNTYKDLLHHAIHAVEEFNVTAESNGGYLQDTSAGSLPISYNLAMTTEGMAIFPRRAEGGILRRDDGTEVGFIALNGTTLGGTLMVKFQEEYDIMREQPEKLDSILSAIGIPKFE